MMKGVDFMNENKLNMTIFFALSLSIAILFVTGCSTGVVDNTTGNVVYGGQSTSQDNLNIVSSSGNVQIPGNLVEDHDKIQVYFFWGDGCPYCAVQKEFHEELKNMFPGQIQFMEFETYRVPANVDFMRKIAAEYNMNPRAVPLTFIGNEYFTGFARASTGNQMIEVIGDCIDNGCESPYQKLIN